MPRYDVNAALILRPRPEANRQCKLHERRIQFASAQAAAKAGVDVEVAQERPMAEFVTAAGEITYDLTRVARLSARVPGLVWLVEKKAGDPVTQDEVLALVDAAEVGKSKAEFLQALIQFRLRGKTWQNLTRAAGTGAVPDRQLREAETAYNEARIRLVSAQQALVNFGLPPFAIDWLALPEERLAEQVQFLGLPPALAARLDPRTTTANLLPLKAPLDGVIVGREVVPGEVVDSAKVLFTVADTRRMWLNLNARLEDLNLLTVGLPVCFRADGSDREETGAIAWISTSVDQKTRTVRVRANLVNRDARLRDHTFGYGRIVLRDEKHAVVVPREAVHWDGDCYVVFVRDKKYLIEGTPKVFHVRKVRPGAQDDRFTEILAGILPGEVVAAKGSAVLRAQLLSDNLGEG
jgi:cobalt-zinc-cadmium efflux system membrane fusion protein